MLKITVGLMGMLCSMVLMAGTAPAETAAKKTGKVLRHVVLFQFKSGTSKETMKEVESAFQALPKKIDVIIDFEWGTDVSTENLAAGFTHCFFVTFADLQGRDAYLPHPEHKKFVDLVKPHLEKALVVDYWSQN